MSESTDFTNNPFALWAQKFVSTEKSQAKAPSAVMRPDADARRTGRGSVGTAYGHAHVVENEDVDESALFMQAVQNVCPSAIKNKITLPEPLWQLADSVELPNMSKHAKKLDHAKGKAQAKTQVKIPTKAHGKAQPKVQPPPSQSKAGSEASAHKPETPTGNALHQMVDIALANEATPADAEAFLRAMREVQPLAGKGRDVTPEVEPAVGAEQAANLLQEFMDGNLEFALSLTGEYLEGYVVGLDDITMNKLRAGQYSPEAHLDLHGLNAVQAYHALVGFFRNAWYKGMRTLLVVPGRGRNSMDGIGVLRDKLQDWLTQEPFKRVVLAFCTARPADGGPGSVYVLLRKYSKKGRIVWERTPVDPDLF